MGYDVYITRKQDWFDENGNEISFDEWVQYVEMDNEMRLDNFAETKTPDGTLRIESEGIAVWLKYSGHEKDGNMAWFRYFEGNIIVKNPDEEILAKMYSVAQSLNAKVQGGDGEIYDANGQSNWQEIKQPTNISSTVKRWWQFWK